MVTPAGLESQLAQKVNEIKEAVAGLSDDQAAKPKAEGEWSAKEVLSHLCGESDALSMYEMKRFLDEDNPDLGISPGSYFDIRGNAPLSDLVSKLEADYQKIGSFLGGLSEEQLTRKGHIPFLKETPLGEYPTLGQWAGAVINFHLNDHIQQLRNLSR